MWVKATSPQANGDYDSLFRWTDDGSTDVDFRCYWSGYGVDTMRCQIEGGSNDNIGQINYATQLGTSWTFLLLTVLDGGNMTLWINGSNVDSVVLTGTPDWLDAADLYVGSSKPNTAENFDGLIDEFMIFDKVLDDAEIASLWNSGSGISYGSLGGGGANVTDAVFVSPTPVHGANNNTQVNFSAICDTGNTTIIYFNESSNPVTIVANNTNNASYLTRV